jgi:hypothetical protein
VSAQLQTTKYVLLLDNAKRRRRPALYNVDYWFAMIVLRLHATRAIVDFDIGNNLALVVAVIV